MRADEIRRHVVALTEVDKLFYPLALGCGRSADLERWRDLLDRFSRVTIELEVFALSSGPKRFQIWLIPDFKQPFTHFLLTVTLNPVRNQTLDQRSPTAL